MSQVQHGKQVLFQDFIIHTDSERRFKIENKIKVGDKEFTVKEIKYKDMASVDPEDKP